MSFHSPHVLWLLVPLLYPLATWIWGLLRDAPSEVTYAKALPTSDGQSKKPGWTVLFFSAGIFLTGIALAEPFHAVRAEGERSMSNVVIVTDLSASMLLEDFFRDGARINRLDASKAALADYLVSCSGDSVGLITFAGEVNIISPLTNDTRAVAAEVKQLKAGQLKDGTAIGDAINVAITLFPALAKEGRINTILLLSDGADNRSTVTPAEAAQKAAHHGITIHTIGIGTDGIVPMPVFGPAGEKIGYRRAISDFDAQELSEVAAETGGMFSRAVDLQQAYQALRVFRTDQEKRTVTRDSSTDGDLSWAFALPGVGLLAVSGLLKVLSRIHPEGLAA
jgi:Ca-activated chloride channel family protein